MKLCVLFSRTDKKKRKTKSYSKRYLINTKHLPQSVQSKYLNKIYFFHVGEKEKKKIRIYSSLYEKSTVNRENRTFVH